MCFTVLKLLLHAGLLVFFFVIKAYFISILTCAFISPLPMLSTPLGNLKLDDRSSMARPLTSSEETFLRAKDISLLLITVCSDDTRRPKNASLMSFKALQAFSTLS